MTRVACDFLHDASSVCSRNRMRQSQAKVVPSKSALKHVLKSYDIFCDVHDSSKRVVGLIYTKQFVS